MFIAGVLTGFAIPFVAALIWALVVAAFDRTRGTKCLVPGCWLDMRAGEVRNIVLWVAVLRHRHITCKRKWHKEAWAKSPRNRANWGNDG